MNVTVCVHVCVVDERDRGREKEAGKGGGEGSHSEMDPEQLLYYVELVC